MKVFEAENRDKYNAFVTSFERDSCLQSWDWGDFQSELGNKNWRLVLEDEGDIIAAANFHKVKAPMGFSYFYCPRGPILESGVNALMPLFNEIAKIAKKEKAVFFRFEPWRPIMNYDFKEIKIGDWTIIKTRDVQPSETIVLDLSKSEGELSAAMHQKTRYNIRLAEKKGVEVEKRGLRGFDDFWKLTDVTTKRDRFTSHSRGYYEKVIKTCPEKAKLYVATYEGEVLAAGIWSFYGDTVTYLYGASSDKNRSTMAPFLLQWRLIQEAKKAGYRYYDFFGISEKKWPGVTRFKRGFGGEEIKYPGTFDVVFGKNQYKAYDLLRKARKLIRL